MCGPWDLLRLHLHSAGDRRLLRPHLLLACAQGLAVALPHLKVLDEGVPLLRVGPLQQLDTGGDRIGPHPGVGRVPDQTVGETCSGVSRSINCASRACSR